MSADWDQLIRQVFDEASELPGGQRTEFLARRCAGDSALRRQVERLLRCDDDAGSGFLGGQSVNPAGRPIPSQIGRFRVLRKIGEGGMGAVFEAEQDHPRRKVALKMVRNAGLSSALLRRFEHEVQILGQLRHPGIAQIHEAGVHNDGAGPVPYFAMELVQGLQLRDFVRERSLSVRQRLELMADICDAVHHAHQRGVIHRDLKPANVLIEEAQMGRPQPKILDFGVARATHCDTDLVTMHTEVGQLVGTLTYMSPEQISGRPDEIDSRSDVYALGVMLYELLADRLPYDLRNRTLADAGAIVREQEPSRLSSIDSAFRGDIETIVAKTLAKERQHRYPSAAELAEDLRRFLRDEPIVARPASKAYQIHKFTKRHKGLVGGAIAAFLALLIGMIATGVALIRATQAERVALERLEESRRLEAKATAVSRFLQNMLSGVEPENIDQASLTVREVLDHAAARLERELTDEPEVAASLHQTLGRHYSTLGYYFDADRHLRKAVELRRSLAAGDDPELADALADLAANLQEKRDIGDAEAPTREALEMRRRVFGPDSLKVAESLYDLGSILIERGRAKEAESIVRESLAIRRRHLGASDATVATSMGLLGWCLMSLGRLDEAESAMRDAVQMVRSLPGDNEKALAGRLTFLSDVLRARGYDLEEEAVLREAVEIRSRRLAENHPALAWNLLRLAQVCRKLDKLEEAKTAGHRALDIYMKRRGPQHRDISDCQQLLAQVYDDLGRYAEAEGWWSACLDMRRQLLPPEHAEIKFAENGLARCRAAQKDAFGTAAETAVPNGQP